jgi:tRNA modification GTPase
MRAMAGGELEDRRAALRSIRHPRSGELIDRAVVLFFAGPRSETGEDVCELQVHGGTAVVAATLEALGLMPGCRMAEPGEFARRAFENGKIDLLEAEGLADLIDAETEAQRRSALTLAGGAQSRLYESWRSRIIECAALTEAAIDFSDEGDVSHGAFQQARERAQALFDEMRAHLNDGRRGEIMRDGFRVVLAGPPNVGKSSLLNALAQRDVAIVSEVPGTTRDVLDVHLNLGGVRVIVSDTAGVRESADPIEREGIRRTVLKAEQAHLVLWVTEANSVHGTVPKDLIDLIDDWGRVVSKADLLTANGKAEVPNGAILASVIEPNGLNCLDDFVSREAARRAGDVAAPALTQARHRVALTEAVEGLRAFLDGSADQVELRAEDLRRAAFAIGRMTGRVDVEDVLGVIFGRFCIGK